MKITHSGITYECEYAVKCENDRYIKLYDSAMNEIAAFHGINDFNDFECDGTFSNPCTVATPIALSTHVIPGATINSSDWIQDESGYYFDIENAMISGNNKTCNIILNFAAGTEIEYNAEQSAGKIRLFVEKRPNTSVVIDSMIVFRA